MARSRRRTSRRTTSQRAAGLIAMALPAPIQRVANTRVGSILLLVAVPAMIVFGLLNVTWQDGFPSFSLNRNRAAELRRAAQERLNDLEHQAATEDWGQSAVNFLHAAQGPNHTHAPAFPPTTPLPTNPATTWQQQQQPYPQQPYQQQAYQQQQTYQQQPYQQQQTYQQQPYQQYSQYPQQQGKPVSPYGQPPPPNPPWSGNAGYPINPGYGAANNGTANYGSAAQPNGFANGYPAGYPQQNPNSRTLPPQAGYGYQNSYSNQNGQLGRY